MKRIQHTIIFLLCAGMAAQFSACDEKKDGPADGPPTILRVTTLGERSEALPSAVYGAWIIIHGNYLRTAKTISFNGVEVAPADFYAEDNSLTVRIPETLPDPADNPIKVVTAFGETVFAFRILQPEPEIHAVTPSIGDPGEIVTIVGLHFKGVSKVTFNDEQAEIVSGTQTEVQVKIPPSAFGIIRLTTPSGTASAPNTFGFKHLVYGDALRSGWSSGSYSGNYTISDPAVVKRGTHAFRASYGGWGAVRLRYSDSAPELTFSDYTAVKFSVYAEAANLGKRIRVYLNNNAGSGSYIITMDKTDEWVEYQIPLNAFGSPAKITDLTFQNWSSEDKRTLENAAVYFDDIGLL